MYYSSKGRSFLSSISIENNTITEIGCFAILWGRIEYCFFENFYKDCKLDNFARELESVSDWTAWFNEIVRAIHRWNPCVNNSIALFISRLRSKGDSANRLKLILGNVLPSNEEKIWACLYVCSRVRNNMFHGEKDEWALNEQITIFAVLNDFLSNLLTFKQCYHTKTDLAD